jgi:hypothetical protein
MLFRGLNTSGIRDSDRQSRGRQATFIPEIRVCFPRQKLSIISPTAGSALTAGAWIDHENVIDISDAKHMLFIRI